MENTITLPEYHNSGKPLFNGLEIFCKSSHNKGFQSGYLRGWKINPIENDITGFAKYAQSIAQIEINGKLENWPFSMLFLSI